MAAGAQGDIEPMFVHGGVVRRSEPKDLSVERDDCRVPYPKQSP